MVSKCICKFVVCNCGCKCVIATEKSSSSCSRETPLVSLPLQVFGTQVCFTSGEHIVGRGMSPAISLDEAAGRAVLGDRGKPLYVLDWPQSKRGHCADLCWMAGWPPLRDGYLVSNYISQHWAKQWAPPPQKKKEILAGGSSCDLISRSEVLHVKRAQNSSYICSYIKMRLNLDNWVTTCVIQKL